jgi:hypothetical protein
VVFVSKVHGALWVAVVVVKFAVVAAVAVALFLAEVFVCIPAVAVAVVLCKSVHFLWLLEDWQQRLQALQSTFVFLPEVNWSLGTLQP